MVEKYYTPKQIAEILQIHQYTVLKWIREGRLKALKFGRVYRTTESELENFLGNIQPRSHKSAEVIHKNRTAPESPTVENLETADEYHLELEPQKGVMEEEPQAQDHYIL